MARDSDTAGFSLNHAMLRVKDPKTSLKFYTEVLGMELIEKLSFKDFSLYFIGYDHSNGVETSEEKKAHRRSREGVVELWHDHGTEDDPDFRYASGNSLPGKGFGHLAVCVDDVNIACERFERLGVTFQKRPDEGFAKGLAFIADPDGYWIEIIPKRI